MGDSLFNAFLADRPIEPYRLPGVERSEKWLRLGQTAISTEHPVWRFDIEGWLADSARYYLHPMQPCSTYPSGAILIFFRQFDKSVAESQPADYYAGWVAPAQEEEAHAMVAEMNRHLEQALTWKIIENNEVQTCLNCQNGRIGPTSEVRRTAHGERYHLVGVLMCNECGQTAGFDAPLHFLVDLTKPGNPPQREVGSDQRG